MEFAGGLRERVCQVTHQVSGRLSDRVELFRAFFLVSRPLRAVSGTDRGWSRGVFVTAARRRSGQLLARLQTGLSIRDWDILSDVNRFRLMTGNQLSQLHFQDSDTGQRTARRTLSRLHERRILSRLARRVGGLRAGSDGYVYALGPVGDRLLREGRPRRRVREVSDGFARHTLGIAQLHVDLVLASRLGGFTILTVETEPQCWRRVEGLGGYDWLKPDLAVVTASADQEVHSFVELDLGTEHRGALIRKLQAYEAAYRAGAEAHRRGLFPQVVWLVPDAARLAALDRLIRTATGLTAELHRVVLIEQAVVALTGAPP